MPGPRILIVGGGYVGMYTALRLQRRLRRDEASVTVIGSQAYMTYQPFLPEAAAGNLEPRHMVVPLRRELDKCEVLTGTVTEIRHADRQVTFRPDEGPERAVGYDVLVVAPGSIAKTLPIPGLAECGIGFRTVAEAVYLRNQVLSRLDLAASTDDEAVRRRALSFVFIGGGYAGIEAIAELQDMARDALRSFKGVAPDDMSWTMVEATERILPEVSLDMAEYTVRQLERSGIKVRLKTKVTSLEGGVVQLDDGTSFPADTVVWTAGVRPNPLLERSDLPLDGVKRVQCDAQLRVAGVESAWSAGDCAAVPDVTKGEGAMCGPTAQHAVRQAKQLADNIVATLRGREATTYRHAYAGSVASLGLHRGVAEIYGIKLRGLPAWWMHRTYHVARLPTTNRKLRVLADWTLALFFRREIVSLGSFADPRRDFERAATGG
ncbi:MAG TPA: NAD(P)/FAD-dependent oxidoreductase, partial [Mycobacteriales bacterium]|nr:NAD(P)/FAD-dependent oxidoreductase [Mycobacteriales bacterium]